MLTRAARNLDKKEKPLGAGCAVLFGGIFIAGGLAVGLFLYFPMLIDSMRVQSWIEIPCEVKSVNMETSHSSKGGTSYRVVAEYRYKFRGRTHEGDRVGLTSGADNVGDFQQRVYDELKPFQQNGTPFRCFVNPSDPSQAVLYREMRWGLAALVSLFPMLFPLVGGFVTFAGIVGSRNARRCLALRESNPGAPWKWRLEWEGAAVTPKSDGLGICIAVSALILLVQLPLVTTVVVTGTLSESSQAGLAFLPALLALIPLRMAWNRLRRRRVIGVPSLEIKVWPMEPGRTIQADLMLAKNISPRETLIIKVTCSKVTTRSTGKGMSTRHETVWENTQTISSAEAQREIIGSRLPLSIDLPSGYPAADVGEDTHGSAESHEWILEVGARSVPGSFKLPLPVFGRARDHDDQATNPHEAPAPPVIDGAGLAERLQKSGIVTAFGPDGTLSSIHCPARRMRAVALFLIVFGLVWSAIFIALVAQGAPLLFRLIWGVTSPAILLGGLWMLIHDRRFEIVGSELCVRSRAGPFYSKVQRFEARHIVRFTTDSNMQSGNQSFYRVRAETTFAKTITLVDGIRDSVTAEALARKLTEWKEGG